VRHQRGTVKYDPGPLFFDVGAEADLWMKGDANTTMMSVLREGFQIEQTRVHHRIYVCDPAKVCRWGPHTASQGSSHGVFTTYHPQLCVFIQPTLSQHAACIST
jgi:hypothetical protein